MKRANFIIWTRKPSVRKVVKRTAGQAGIVCGANIRRDVTISHSAVKQKDRDVSSGITVLQGGEDVNTQAFLFSLDDTKALPSVAPQASEVKRVFWMPIGEALAHTEWMEDHWHILNWAVSQR